VEFIGDDQGMQRRGKSHAAHRHDLHGTLARLTALISRATTVSCVR
jgi:hypothetical protein